MKQCPQCQAELNDDSLFCSKCGSSVASSPEPSSKETAAPAKKPVYKTFLFWVILISVAFFIAKGIVNVLHGMPMSDFTGDLTVIFVLSVISLIPFAIIHTIVENTPPAKRKFARSVASVLYFLIFFVVASFTFIASTTMTYDPNYTEEDKFRDYIFDKADDIIDDRFAEAGYTITARSARENRPLTEIEPGKYTTACKVIAEQGISGTRTFMCYVRFQKDVDGNWYCYDFEVTNWIEYD